jgi:hypothetical protein
VKPVRTASSTTLTSRIISSRADETWQPLTSET